VLASWQKGSSAPSVRSPVVDEERTSSGHWLGSVLCVYFSALTLLVECQEEHPALERPCVESSLPAPCGGSKLTVNWLTQVHVEDGRVTEVVCMCSDKSLVGHQEARLLRLQPGGTAELPVYCAAISASCQRLGVDRHHCVHS